MTVTNFNMDNSSAVEWKSSSTKEKEKRARVTGSIFKAGKVGKGRGGWGSGGPSGGISNSGNVSSGKQRGKNFERKL